MKKLLCLFVIALSCMGMSSWLSDSVIDVSMLKYTNNTELTGNYPYDHFVADLSSATINIKGESGSSIVLKISYKEYAPGDASFFIDNGTLKIKTKSGKPALITELSGSIPKNLDLSLKTGSGDIIINNFLGEELFVSSGSGDITASNVEADEKLTLSTGSGDISLSDASHISTCKLSTGSGDVTVFTAINLKNGQISTGSGEITLTRLSSDDYFKITSGSGNISMEKATLNNLKMSSGSGDLILTDCEVNHLNYSTGSGKLHLNNSKVNTD